MFKQSLLLSFCATLLASPNCAFSQTANATVGLTSLVTSQLVTPAAPQVSLGGSAGSTSYTYKVVALDTTNSTGTPMTTGTTPASSGTTISNGQSNLSTGNNIVTTPVVSGASNCVVYRTASGGSGTSGTTGRIGSPVTCGQALTDNGSMADGTTPPSTNTTGSMTLSGNLQAGTVTAQSFVAQGSTAGGDTWVGGSPAGSVLGNSITFEAPSTVSGGSSNAYAVILPQNFPSTTGPMLFQAGTGAVFKTSTASFGSLTNPSSTTLATTAGGSLADGNFARISNSAGAIDIADSGISATNQTANTVLAGPSSGGAAAPAFRPLVVADVPSTAAFVSFCASAVGTAAATTYVLAPYAQTTSTCNATTVTEMPMPHVGTAKNLFVIASTAGKDATSGIVTLYANGSATALTCTLGTGLTCSDVTHTASFTPAGESFSVRVKTSTLNSNDTTANIRVTFDYQ